jgi:hypothetical protein
MMQVSGVGRASEQVRVPLTLRTFAGTPSLAGVARQALS